MSVRELEGLSEDDSEEKEAETFSSRDISNLTMMTRNVMRILFLSLTVKREMSVKENNSVISNKEDVHIQARNTKRSWTWKSMIPAIIGVSSKGLYTESSSVSLSTLENAESTLAG